MSKMVNIKNGKLYIGFVIIMVGALMVSTPSCSGKTDNYDKASLDTLFLGMTFGMSRQAFYDTCWHLNKKKLITNGGSSLSVLFETDSLLPYPVKFNYYPDFVNDKIYRLPVIVSYSAWAPWNKELWSDKLILDVKELLEEWFGKGFKRVNSKSGIQFVKKDGPRTIKIFTQDDRIVKCEITHADYEGTQEE